MKRLWPLAIALVIGAALGSGSMAFYLYNYQLKVDSNTAEVRALRGDVEKLKHPRIIKPLAKKPMAAPKRRWWELWRR